VIGIVVVVGIKGTDGKGPIRIVKNIPQGLPPFTANLWAPVMHIDKLLPLAFIIMAVDMLESTSIARALARKSNYGEWAEAV
jgi:sulfate transporter 4